MWRWSILLDLGRRSANWILPSELGLRFLGSKSVVVMVSATDF